MQDRHRLTFFAELLAKISPYVEMTKQALKSKTLKLNNLQDFKNLAGNENAFFTPIALAPIETKILLFGGSKQKIVVDSGISS